MTDKEKVDALYALLNDNGLTYSAVSTVSMDGKTQAITITLQAIALDAPVSDEPAPVVVDVPTDDVVPVQTDTGGVADAV